MSSRVRALPGAAVLAASLLGVAAAPGMAANTRIVNFGSAPCPATLVTCPTAVPASASAYPYPYGTVGSLTPSGQAVAGQLSFTPVTAGSSTATDVFITNLAPSTLTQVHVSGGSQAPTSINTGSVVATPVPIDPAPCASNGTCPPSLPGGLYYQAVYVVANPAAIPVSCSLTASTSLSVGLYDGLNCSIGNLAAQRGLTLRVVIAATAATSVEPWFALHLKEGS